MFNHDEAQAAIDALVAEILDTLDPLEGAGLATGFQKQLRAATTRLAEVRSAFMRQAFAYNYSLEEIASACGITKQRVEQIVKR